MARRKDTKSNSAVEIILGAVILLIIVAVGGNLDTSLLDKLRSEFEIDSLENVNTVETSNKVETNALANVDGNLVIDYIDVGQGDSILIRQGSHAMLIDGGTSECKDTLLDFIDSEDVTYFDYIIGTHPHEDHIGSLDDVVSAYDFDKILFPRVTTNTRTFENLVKAVSDKGKKFTTPLVGTEYSLGDAKFVILGPGSDSYQSLNNYSIVIKMTYGNNTFMFTGDAETLEEKEILNSFEDLHADVLKIGHHGSTTSCSQKFLNAVSPSYAVISVGKDNSYNHPTKTTMEKLQKLGLPVYRTDEQGTIECVSNGETITFNVEPGSYAFMKD